MEVSKSVRWITLALGGGGALIAAHQWSPRAAGDTIVEAMQRTERPMVVGPSAATTSAGETPVPTPMADPVASPNPSPAASAATSPKGPLPQERTRSIDSANGEAFAVLHWLPPAAPAPPPPPAPVPRVVAPPPPPAPSAPPMPFVFVGMLEKGMARPQAFLAKGETLLVVAAGDLLDNKTYRIESLTPQEVVMTYLPLDIKQTLPITGGAK